MTSVATRPRPGPRRGIAGLLVAALLFVFLPTLMGLLRPDALPGATVLGTEVGGLDGPRLRAAVEDIASARAREPITVRRTGQGEPLAGGEPDEVAAITSDTGYDLDVEATVQAVQARGRQVNPLAAWGDHLRSIFGEMPVAPVDGVDGARLQAWAGRISGLLARDPVEGAVAFDGVEVVRTDPQAGVAVDADEVADKTRAAALQPGPATVTVDNQLVHPDTTVEAVDRAVAIAERVVAGPVRLRRDGAALELSPARLAQLVAFERSGDGLVATLPPDALDAVVADSLRAALEREPSDAVIALDDGRIHITESTEGFRFDPAAVASQALDLATGRGSREATLDGEVIAPERSTADAEGLGIVEEVSSFTTHFQAGQDRVANIQRIADLVDGVVLEPGETFSVNGHVGERTEEKGFVEGGAILRGEFVEQVGGGVSQFATTLYNAAYFGGYEIVEHKAHSYYISRYPPGREATLDYPSVDLRIRNNSPHGALIAASHTDTSVTVSMWGTPWVEVEAEEGERTRVREGEVRDGFDIVVTRVLRYPDGREERQSQLTRYLPEDEPPDDESGPSLTD